MKFFDTNNTKGHQILLLILIVGVSCFFRLYDLGSSTMGSDTMEFFKIVQQGMSPWELAKNSQQYVPTLAPFWFAAHNALVQVFQLDVSYGTVRLLDAIAGILTVLAFYGVGCQLGNRYTGLFAACFAGLHPVLIQMSRECYFYSAVLLGAVLMIWGLLILINAAENQQQPGVSFFLATFSGYIFVTYTHSSPWGFAAITGIAICFVIIKAILKKQWTWKIFIILAVGLFVLSIPLLFSEWGIRLTISQFLGSEAEHWGKIFGEQDRIADIPRYAAALRSFLFGKSVLGACLNVLVLVTGIGWTIRTWKKSPQTRIILILAVVICCQQLLIHAKSVHAVKSAHLTPVIPFFVIFVCVGFSELIRWSTHAEKKWKYSERAARVMCFVLVILVFARPAVWSMSVESNSPWKSVARWADRNLPQGTLVLCDRWLTPWNEMRVNSSTNAFFTFTIPNEPVDQYCALNWRQTAETFIQNHPFCAYLDRRQYWDRLGPWKKPFEYFSNKITFRDEPNIKLIKRGLAYRDPFDAEKLTNSEIRILYNTESEALEHCRQQGKKAVCNFSGDWGYIKPWSGQAGWSPQLLQLLWIQAGAFRQDGLTFKGLDDVYRLSQNQLRAYLEAGRWEGYRIPSQNTELQVFNLTGKMQKMTLSIVGVSLSGNIRTRINENTQMFPQNLMVKHILSFDSSPGMQQLPLFASPMQPLLLLDVSVEIN